MNYLLLVVSIMLCCTNIPGQAQTNTFPCFYTNKKIKIDGDLDDKAWKNIPWSSKFTDIRGDAFPKPIHTTRFKMCWNKKYLFVAAKIDDSHIWATMLENESPLFQEDAFEVFIDPERDGLDYFELEVNPLGTTWDLQMDKPYVNGGTPNSNWSIDGLKIGIQVNGTIDNQTDEDEGWILEIAIPIATLYGGEQQCKKDLLHQIWSINFLRTDWDLNIVHQPYLDREEKEKAARFWVWKPHGIINMHVPNRWGKIQFLK